jgi:hypothetical protein
VRLGGLALLLLLAPIAGASAQPSLPDKPIHQDDRTPCEQYGFLEGKACGALAAADEPVLPVTRRDVKLAFRLNWGRGGEHHFQSIVARIELLSASRGFIDFVEFPDGKPMWGFATLTADEISSLLQAANKAGFWTLPLTGGTRFAEDDPKTGGVLIHPCRGTFALSGMEADWRRVLQRDCPTEKTDPALLAFVRAIIRTGRHYRDWFAADKDFWPDMQ